MKRQNEKKIPPKDSTPDLQVPVTGKLFLIDFGSQKEPYANIRRRLLRVVKDTPAIWDIFPYGKQTYYLISDPIARSFDLWLFIRRIFPKKRFLVMQLSLDDHAALNPKLWSWLKDYKDTIVEDLPF